MNGLGRNDKEKNDKQSILTKETWGVVIILFSTLLAVCLITGESVFFEVGKYVQVFLLGCFGYFSYAVVFTTLIFGIKLVVGKKISIPFKRKFLFTMAMLSVALLSHVISMGDKGANFNEYISLSYSLANGGLSTCSAGGFFTALMAYPVKSLLTVIGGAVVLGALAVFFIAFLVRSIILDKKATRTPEKFRNTYIPEKKDNGQQDEMSSPTSTDLEDEGMMSYVEAKKAGTIEKEQPQKKTQSLFINNEDDFAFKTKREIAKDNTAPIKVDFSEGRIGVVHSSGTYTESYADEMKKKLEYIKTPPKIDLGKNNDNKYYSTTSISKEIPKQEEERKVDILNNTEIQIPSMRDEIPLYEHDKTEDNSAEKNAQEFLDKYAYNTESIDNQVVADEPEEIFRNIEQLGSSNSEEQVQQSSQSFEQEEQEDVSEAIEEQIQDDTPAVTNIFGEGRRRRFSFEEDIAKKEEKEPEQTETDYQEEKKEDFSVSSRRGAGRLSSISDSNKNIGDKQEEKNSLDSQPKKEQPPINRVYNKPPIDLLERYSTSLDSASEDHQENMRIIQQTLEDFHINAVPQGYIQGPTITRYEIAMPSGVSVKKVLNYDDDLKMYLKSKNGIRIEAPIPGKNLIGIEVANKHKVTVGLRELLENFNDKGGLTFVLGKNIVGDVMTDNLAKGPHYLVAGATGSGKSVCLNVMIMSLIYRFSPEDLRLILVDPKSVGFRIYEHLPHLMIDEIITEPKRALAALSWAQVEMERRYKLLYEFNVSDLDAYNEKAKVQKIARLPRIVVIIDELADLMETCKKEMEGRIRALAQKARAAGIHLVLATQRPSVDIITGTIKANLPSRIGLKLMTYNDSTTILSEGGAEKLLGNGDMLYKNSGMPECERYQGAWVSDREISSVVNYIIENNQAYFDDELSNFLDKETTVQKEEVAFNDNAEGGDNVEVNDFFIKALGQAVLSGSVSISMLQRRFQIGYARAGGLVDKMEQMGFVSANEGSKARKVLITREEFINRFGVAPED